jgi:hypothetical protein
MIIPNIPLIDDKDIKKGRKSGKKSSKKLILPIEEHPDHMKALLSLIQKEEVKNTMIGESYNGRSTPSFVLELPLNTNPSQESIILTRLEAGRQILNACIGEALKRLALIKQSKEYQRIIKLEKGRERTQKFKELNKKFGFTDADLQHYAVEIRHSWLREHIGVHIAQKLATRAFKAVQKKAFGKAKNVRFKGKNQFDTLEGKINSQNLTFDVEDKVLRWKGLDIPVIIDNDKGKYDKNERRKIIEYSLQHRIKYCRLARRKLNGKNRFYVQLILEGIPYQDPKKIFGKEEIGLDVGPSTVAIVGDTKAELKEFCSDLKYKQKKKRILQRKLDRSRRANNPDNYNENGTIKKGKKKWKISGRYIKTNIKIAELDRKTVAHRKSLHGHDQNIVLNQGVEIKTEKISYKSWQKIYGRSILMRAPSMFINGLKRKAENAGGHLIEFPTQNTKLSQVCHKCGKYVKKPLSQRWHVCCGLEIQRDLYSAFLAKCVDENTNSLDIVKAKELWQGLEQVLSEAVSRVKQSANGRNLPSSFGLNQRQSRSLVKTEESMIDAEDVVTRDNIESESFRKVV